MRVELTEMVWLEQHVMSLPELCELSGLSWEEIEELVGSGAIEPMPPVAPIMPTAPSDQPDRQRRFGAAALRAARSARRLRDDFELDAQALTVVLSLLERINELEAQLRELRARLPLPLARHIDASR